MARSAELVTIGKIERTFGVRGEVRVRSLSDVPGRFEGLKAVTLVSPNGNTLATKVTHVRLGGDSYIVGLEAFSNPDDAAAFRGGFVQVPRQQSPALPDGQYYEGDLIGMTVQDEDGRPLGTVEEVWDLPSHHVLVVRRQGKELLVPATKQAVASVNIDEQVLTIRADNVLVDEQHAV